MLYLSFKFVRKFKFCVSPLVKRYPGLHFMAFSKSLLDLFVIGYGENKKNTLHLVLHPKPLVRMIRQVNCSCLVIQCFLYRSR